MSILELLPTIAAVSHADKFSLARSSRLPETEESFDPVPYFGLAHESRQSIEEYMKSAREQLSV